MLREYAAGVAQTALPTLAAIDSVGMRTGPTGPNGAPLGGTPIDEVVGPDGTLRPAWKHLAEVAVSLTEADLRRLAADMARMLSDDGATYSPSGHGSGPWRLDPIPLVIEAAAWARLEIGLAQRAELLNAILVDLYGPRRLLAERVVPPAAIFSHPGYLRVLARPSSQDPHPLIISATDLGRDASGDWRVLGDRAQAPSGLGYAMENRRVISRAVPELYRSAGLHQVRPYLSALRTTLLESAPESAGEDPRVVVLSPGTASETAYDQAFLASSLGFPLVQGHDLTVRDGAVWTKGFAGVQQVHVILRRVDATWSDPLELRGDSQLGVAGLTEAVRRGSVRVVNGLGSGILENPALLPFLPAASELLLGEPLRIEAVPTLWCGDPHSREQVLDRLDELVVRAVDTPGLRSAIHAAPGALRRRILADPYRYVGQEPLPMSQAPTWVSRGPERGMSSRPITLRTFTMRYHSSYRPLIGGLATTHSGLRFDRGRAHDGQISSKDVWVLKARPEDPDQGMGEVAPMALARAATLTVPRVLEDMFWFGRYAERAEDQLRVILGAHPLADTSPGEPVQVDTTRSDAAGLDALCAALARLAGRWHPDLDGEFRSLLLDTGRNGSVAQSLAALREALEGVRDQLSLDTWRAFTLTDRATKALADNPHTHQVAGSAADMLTAILSLQGVTSSMIRDAGWHMIAVGHALERALQVGHLLAATATVQHSPMTQRAVLAAVLDVAESSVTHRRRYRGQVRLEGVLDLLLLDGANPRAVAAALADLRAHLAALPASTGATRPERLTADLIDTLGELDAASLTEVRDGERPALSTFLAGMNGTLERIGQAITDLHFTSGPRPRSFGAPAHTRFGPAEAVGA